MNFLEKNLEDIIYETDNDSLSDRGLWINGIKKRQVRIGNYGIADLVTFDRGDGNKITITIYELKRNVLNADSFMQLVGYMRGAMSYLEKRGKHKYIIQGVLVGNSVDTNGSFCYVADVFRPISIYTFQYKFDGIWFNEAGEYKLTNEGF